MRRFDRVASALTAGVFVVVGGAAVSCSRTVDPVPLRTFERAQNMDVVCLEVADAQGNALPLPRPAAQSRCTAAPAGSLTFATHHLFGLVTQTARGEVAVVDLTAGRIVDLDSVHSRHQLPHRWDLAHRRGLGAERCHQLRGDGRAQQVGHLRPPERASCAKPPSRGAFSATALAWAFPPSPIFRSAPSRRRHPRWPSCRGPATPSAAT